MALTHKDEKLAVEQVIERLVAKYPHLDPAVVAEVVHREHDELEASRIRDYIPVLVEHAAKEKLRPRRLVAA